VHPDQEAARFGFLAAWQSLDQICNLALTAEIQVAHAKRARLRFGENITQPVGELDTDVVEDARHGLLMRS
jgi:hypothetical protein